MYVYMCVCVCVCDYISAIIKMSLGVNNIHLQMQTQVKSYTKVLWI